MAHDGSLSSHLRPGMERSTSVYSGPLRAEKSDSQSDVDFLVDLEPGRTLSDLGGLLMDLQETLGTPVDVVTEKGLRVRLRARVVAEAVPL